MTSEELRDRELLELAAKAAGLHTGHKWNRKRLALDPPVIGLCVHAADGELLSTNWNPLAYDGDALLAGRGFTGNMRLVREVGPYDVDEATPHGREVIREIESEVLRRVKEANK